MGRLQDIQTHLVQMAMQAFDRAEAEIDAIDPLMAVTRQARRDIFEKHAKERMSQATQAIAHLID